MRSRWLARGAVFAASWWLLAATLWPAPAFRCALPAENFRDFAIPSPDGRFLVVDGAIAAGAPTMVIETATGKLAATFVGGYARNVSFSTDGRFAQTGTRDGVAVKELSSGKTLTTLEFPSWNFLGSAFGADATTLHALVGETLPASGWRCRLETWDWRAGRRTSIALLELQAAGIHNISRIGSNSQGTLLAVCYASASATSNIAVFALPSGRLLKNFALGQGAGGDLKLTAEWAWTTVGPEDGQREFSWVGVSASGEFRRLPISGLMEQAMGSNGFATNSITETNCTLRWHGADGTEVWRRDRPRREVFWQVAVSSGPAPLLGSVRWNFMSPTAHQLFARAKSWLGSVLDDFQVLVSAEFIEAESGVTVGRFPWRFGSDLRQAIPLPGRQAALLFGREGHGPLRFELHDMPLGKPWLRAAAWALAPTLLWAAAAAAARAAWRRLRSRRSADQASA